MSRAESHDVGGGGPCKDAEGEAGGGLEGRVSKASGAGEGDCLSLSLRVIVWIGQGQRTTCLLPFGRDTLHVITCHGRFN
jgi:hypothetical protein